MHNQKIGVTVGKFYPPHIGHKLMIDMASTHLDLLYVIIGYRHEEELLTGPERLWILGSHYYNNSKVVVVPVLDDIGDAKAYDEYGTAIDEEFWNKWTRVFNDLVPDATHFVSSDFYGKEAARRLGIEWFPVDPDRETIDISGTEIRKDIQYCWDFLIPESKAHFTKKVAIVGPESTGKSTMTKNLAKAFNTVGVHEYGRTLSTTVDHDLVADDFVEIVSRQQTLNQSALLNAGPISFLDTEAFTTYEFSKVYLEEPVEELYSSGFNQKVDAYILLAPTVDFVNDGTRVMPDHKERTNFFFDMLDNIKLTGKPFIVVSDKEYSDRFYRAQGFCNELWTKWWLEEVEGYVYE